MLTYPKSHYLEDHISARRGCCAPKFLHVLENDQVLLAHPPPGTGAPLTTFLKEGGSKIGLKWNKWAIITSDETLALDVSLGGGVNASTTFGGTDPLKIWDGKKRAKISAIYDNFRVWAQMSLEPMKIATICKRRWRKRSFGRWTKKMLWNSVRNEPSYKR